MKITAFFALTLVGLAAASAPLKAIIVSYPNGTTPEKLADAKATIVNAGGDITHTFDIITGFAALAPETAIERVKAEGVDCGVVVEEDQVVGIN